MHFKRKEYLKDIYYRYIFPIIFIFNQTPPNSLSNSYVTEALKCFKSPGNLPIVQQLVQTNKKIKTLHRFWGESIGGERISLTEDQLCGKRLHVMIPWCRWCTLITNFRFLQRYIIWLFLLLICISKFHGFSAGRSVMLCIDGNTHPWYDQAWSVAIPASLQRHAPGVWWRKIWKLGTTHWWCIEKKHKSHNAPVPYPRMHHSEQKCAEFFSKCCVVGFVPGALWSL